jgi:hypothetical protein
MMKFVLVLGFAFLWAGSALAQEAEDKWVESKECWKDGTPEKCNGQVVTRRAWVEDKRPVYIEYRHKKSLVGLSLATPYPWVRCDKRGDEFVCVLKAIDGLKGSAEKYRVFDSSEELGTAIKTAPEGLEWQFVRVVEIPTDQDEIEISVPKKNRAKHFKRPKWSVKLKAKSKKEGTTKFFVVPRVFDQK